MMAGISVIQREGVMSTVSITQQVVISPRPYSRRAQSARFLLSQKSGLTTTNREYLINEQTFPDIQRLNISQAVGSNNSSGEEIYQLKGSNFPNFRLLQRLAASAKARISSNSSVRSNKTTCEETTCEKETSSVIDHQLDTITDVDYRSAYGHLPPANEVKDIDRNCKVRGSKSRRQHSNFKTKRPVKRSLMRRNGQPAAHSRLQLTTNKVIPTFSQRFTKQSRRNHPIKQTPVVVSESSNFSLTVYPEYLVKSNSNSDLKERDDQMVSNNCIQEAKLSAIYDTPHGSSLAISDSLNKIKLKKVFQSEKQSGYLTQCGRLLPCAPPTSPTPLVLDKYEIIPSLSDLTSQQSIKQRLTALGKQKKKKQEVYDQEKRRQERQSLQIKFEAQRVRNRQEIYALNKIMTKLEREHFKRFQEKMKQRKDNQDKAS